MFERVFHYIRELFRDKPNLFFSMIFPIMMVFVLGNMLANLDNPDSPIGTISIAYCIEEGPQEGYTSSSSEIINFESIQAVQLFMNALAENESIEILEAADSEAALALVDSKLVDAAMIFETPLKVSIAEGENIYKNRAAKMIAQGFARTYSSYAAIAEMAPEYYMGIAAKAPPEFSALVADKDLGVKRSMIDFYAVTMVIMIAFMGGGIGGATDMFFARQNGTLRRLTASPRGRTRLFLESVFGVVPQNVMQTLLVMIPSTLLLGARYAMTWQQNLLLFAFFILLGIAVTALFMLVGLFVRFNPYMPIMAVIWTLLFMSGTFSKDINIAGVSEYLPMNVAHRAAFDLTMFGRSEQILTFMGVCAIILIASCIIGSMLFRRKEIIL